LPLVSAAIMPHGTAAIPGFTEGKSDFSEVRKGMRAAASVVAATGPQTVVLASPHNLRIKGKMAVVTAENLGGSLEEGKKKVALGWKCDLRFAKELYSLADRRGLPVVSVNFGTSEGRESRMPLDWGTMVPLWFLPHRIKVVLVTPSREIRWSDLVSFGECAGEVARLAPAKISFIASADQGHAHLKTGPYGFDKAADEYDSKVTSLVKSDRLGEISHFTPRLVERAKADSFWQMLILVGALKGSGFRASCCDYSCPTYYGMLSAAFS